MSNSTAPETDVDAILVSLLNQAQALALAINDALARVRKVDSTVPGETTDHEKYRITPAGALSELGLKVMLALLQLGLTDEQVSARMSVTVVGVATRRRKWGRKYGQRG